MCCVLCWCVRTQHMLNSKSSKIVEKTWKYLDKYCQLIDLEEVDDLTISMSGDIITGLSTVAFLLATEMRCDLLSEGVFNRMLRDWTVLIRKIKNSSSSERVGLINELKGSKEEVNDIIHYMVYCFIRGKQIDTNYLLPTGIKIIEELSCQ
jgi:hypothetical protein